MQVQVLATVAGHTLTSKEVIATTGFARRTVYTGLRRLKQMGLVSERGSLRDARQTYHMLTEEGRRILVLRGLIVSTRHGTFAAASVDAHQ